MIKMKNLLAENMVRFGTKNLSEQDLTTIKTAPTNESYRRRIVRRVLKEEECLEPPKWLQNFTFGQAKMQARCGGLTWSSNGYDDNRDETPGFGVMVDLNKMELRVTIDAITPMVDVLNQLETILGKQGYYGNSLYPYFKSKKFTSSEENGDLNIKLDEIKAILLNSNDLKESYRRRYRRY